MTTLIWINKDSASDQNLGPYLSKTETHVLVEATELELTHLQIANIAYEVHPIK